jgi:hypothetical protein
VGWGGIREEEGIVSQRVTDLAHGVRRVATEESESGYGEVLLGHLGMAMSHW